MIITIASYKGGVGKTTAAIHLSAFFHGHGSTVLVDGDPNRSASEVWAGTRTMPFLVVSEAEAPRHARSHEHLIIDTKARPDQRDLQELALGCDLLILPVTPDAFAIHALLKTMEALDAIGGSKYRVLLNIVPPQPNQDGMRARGDLERAGVPMFETWIPRRVEYQRCLLDGRTVNSPQYDMVGEEILAIAGMTPTPASQGTKAAHVNR